MCVQRFDDSLTAIHITYRISLRSSSSQEPRYPLPKVINWFKWCGRGREARGHASVELLSVVVEVWCAGPLGPAPARHCDPAQRAINTLVWDVGCGSRGNDPSAGSPTETLLRLHLPLNDEV